MTASDKAPGKAIVTCALTGVLTNPKQHHVPVTPSEMAASAREAFDAGASIMHIHFRAQEPGLGHFPSWDPEVAYTISQAIREACPGYFIGSTTEADNSCRLENLLAMREVALAGCR